MIRGNHMVSNVLEFNKAFDVKTKETEELYRSLIEEEFEEWLEETYQTKKVPEDELKELCDLLYVIFGYAITRGWDIESAFNRVHKSNMSKLGTNGKPVRNTEGKIQKGVNYKAPKLTDLV